MVDNFNAADPAAVPVSTQGGGGIRGFIGTTTGKLILGVIVFVVLIIAVGAVVLPGLLSGGGGSDAGDVTVPPAGSVTTSGSAQASEEATPTYRKPKPLSTFFVFRDIFEPTVKPVVAGSPSSTSTASGGDTSTADTPDVPPDTLFLVSVDTVDGEDVATFIWNGETYTAGEGDGLAGTPWRVLSIEGDTVTLLFGDTRVTLTVGQGLSK